MIYYWYYLAKDVNYFKKQLNIVNNKKIIVKIVEMLMT